MSKFDGTNTIPDAPSYVITHLLLRTFYREVYGNIAREETKMADLVADLQ